MSHSPLQKCWQNNKIVTSALHWSLISSEHLFEAWNHLLWISIRVAEPCKVCPHLQHCFAEKKHNVKKKDTELDVEPKLQAFFTSNSLFACRIAKLKLKSTTQEEPNPHLIRDCSSEKEVSAKASLEKRFSQKLNQSERHRKKHGNSSAAVAPKSFPPKT